MIGLGINCNSAYLEWSFSAFVDPDARAFWLRLSSLAAAPKFQGISV